MTRQAAVVAVLTAQPQLTNGQAAAEASRLVGVPVARTTVQRERVRKGLPRNPQWGRAPVVSKKEAVISALAEGQTVTFICQQHHVSRSYVSRIRRELA